MDSLMNKSGQALDCLSIVKQICGDNSGLYDLLLLHSRQVAELALEICDHHPELQLDRQFIFEAAILHDVGIVRCDASGIHCHGTEPYIKHGILGADILRQMGLPRHARVAERHTGTGITTEQILEGNLPLPLQDYSPESMEEKVVCYADKFFSKSKPQAKKAYSDALRSVSKFGEECEKRFAEWHGMFK